MRIYRVYETGTDDYIEGPFATRAAARDTSDTEGDGQGEYILVAHSRLPTRLRSLPAAGR